jgi:hypothetical protein
MVRLVFSPVVENMGGEVRKEDLAVSPLLILSS